MTAETIGLIHYGITSAYWLGMVWIGANCIVQLYSTSRVAKSFDRR